MKYSLSLRLILGLPTLLFVAVIYWILLILNQNRFAIALIKTGQNFLIPEELTEGIIKGSFDKINPQEYGLEKEVKPEDLTGVTLEHSEAGETNNGNPIRKLESVPANKRKRNKADLKKFDLAREAILAADIDIAEETDSSILFMWKGHRVTYYPYSEWHSGKSIVDGRGLQTLLNKLKQK